MGGRGLVGLDSASNFDANRGAFSIWKVKLRFRVKAWRIGQSPTGWIGKRLRPH